ncbi:hypothetical protein R5R35_010134 [Gryllus longicercus]|uniref:FAM192A/Fyv6 N-terminal domain-containing protein n=1 Tax=Gryllus longicercus TaxID=2509291 RepID=A0AAN9Z1W8_9ORTH|nr:NEFA-interacting nuclear protein NIP30 [Gryllus bimaculatus]
MSSGFISEAELAERRRARQEEWDKVRKPDDPEEAPEEHYDPRSLFERLEEQKQKRDMEYEEAHKLKNMIKGLDDDEVEFLDLVDRTKIEQERRKCSEEAREIKDFREAVATLQEKSLEQRINTEIRQQTRPASNSQQTGLSSLGSRTSQTRLLAGAVRKRHADSPTTAANPKKPCTSSDESADVEPKTNQEAEQNNSQESKQNDVLESDPHEKSSRKRKERDDGESNGEVTNGPPVGGAMRCIGILPGLGVYHDSSDSEQSSDTDQDIPCTAGYDLLGRKLQSATKKSSQSSER